MIFGGFPQGPGAQAIWPVGAIWPILGTYCSNQTVWSSSSTCNIQHHQTCRNKEIRKKSGCQLRKYEKSRLQYDLSKTEEPGYKIEEIPHCMVAPLPMGRRMTTLRFFLLNFSTINYQPKTPMPNGIPKKPIERLHSTIVVMGNKRGDGLRLSAKLSTSLVFLILRSVYLARCYGTCCLRASSISSVSCGTLPRKN